ncbi:MAG: magnesium transporter [Aestuariivita sp.]|nr:magnesium transporter [Aestuariivita sp.]MCY4347152.1 magnesium transporter [Aestuariivita sp.]
MPTAKTTNNLAVRTSIADESDYRLDQQKVDEILKASSSNNQEELRRLLEDLHPADIADLLEQINSADRLQLVRLYGHEFDGDILSELEEGLRSEVISILKPDVLAEAVRDLESDDVVDLVEDLGPLQQGAILEVLEDVDRNAVTRALAYPEGSAARMMQCEVVMAPEHWTVGQAIDFLRKSDALPDQFYHIVLVDPKTHPLGQVSLGRLMRSKREVELRSLREDVFEVFLVTQPESDIAYAFNQYHLISAPVIDAEGRLAGVITIDDAMEALDAEHQEDILRLAGVGEERLSDRIVDTARRRCPWLFVNLLTAIIASLVIAQFETEIAAIVALAILMPIVASMGGNAGTQSLTVAVRAIATRDLTRSNVWRVISREGIVGLINGVIFAVVMGLVCWLWFGWLMLGIVLAAAMVVNLLVAGLSGAIVPIILQRRGIDPALASGTLVTTVTDVVGFFAFLGLAAIVLL